MSVLCEDLPAFSVSGSGSCTMPTIALARSVLSSSLISMKRTLLSRERSPSCSGPSPATMGSEMNVSSIYSSSFSDAEVPGGRCFRVNIEFAMYSACFSVKVGAIVSWNCANMSSKKSISSSVKLPLTGFPSVVPTNSASSCMSSLSMSSRLMTFKMLVISFSLRCFLPIIGLSLLYKLLISFVISSSPLSGFMW